MNDHTKSILCIIMGSLCGLRYVIMDYHLHYFGIYRKTSSISRTLVGNKIVDNSDVVVASPVGAAPTTSSFST